MIERNPTSGGDGPEAKRAAIYRRVSTDKQEQQGCSLDDRSDPAASFANVTASRS